MLPYSEVTGRHLPWIFFVPSGQRLLCLASIAPTRAIFAVGTVALNVARPAWVCTSVTETVPFALALNDFSTKLLSAFVATLWLQDVKDLSPLESGLAFLAMSAARRFASASRAIQPATTTEVAVAITSTAVRVAPRIAIPGFRRAQRRYCSRWVCRRAWTTRFRPWFLAS